MEYEKYPDSSLTLCCILFCLFNRLVGVKVQLLLKHKNNCIAVTATNALFFILLLQMSLNPKRLEKNDGQVSASSHQPFLRHKFWRIPRDIVAEDIT